MTGACMNAAVTADVVRRRLEVHGIVQGVGFRPFVYRLAREHGLHTCAQEIWSLVSVTVQKRLEVPANLMLFSGMALGYADTSQAINTLRTERATIAEFVRMKGFDAP